MDPRELLTALSDPAAFPEAGPDVRVVQTHISMVFLTGERVYKVKKPVAFWGLVDYRSLERRRHYCEEEIRLDRRFAPEIYLGVLPVVRDATGRVRVGGEGEILDYAVVMRRYPEGSTLEDRIRAGTAVRDDVVAIARWLAAFHAKAAGNASVAFEGRPDVYEGVVDANLRGTQAAVPALFPADLHRAFAERIHRRIADARDTLDRRVRERRLVDGHGDLRAEHAVWIEGGGGGGTGANGAWRLVDGIEFSTTLRSIDPLSDVAFLAMDLAALGRRDLSHALLDAYLEARPDADAPELLPIYLAQRAHVRAAVGARVAVDANVGALAREAGRHSALRHLVLATAYAFTGDRPPLVVLAGPSGVGKSAIAHELSPLLDADVIASDVVRKELAGLPPKVRVTGAAQDALYSTEMSVRTYAEIVARARAALAAWRGAILDATFLKRAWRESAYAMARAADARPVLVWCDAPLEVVRERLAARAAADTDASDATIEVYERQLAEREPPTGAEPVPVVRFDTREAPAAVVGAIGSALWGAVGPA